MPANNHYTKVRNLFLRRAATDHYYYHSHLYFMLCFAHLFCDITQIIIKIRIIKLLCGENSELLLLLLVCVSLSLSSTLCVNRFLRHHLGVNFDVNQHNAL